jgi:hypothetical protein
MSRRISRLIAGGLTVALATVGIQLTGTVDALAHTGTLNVTSACQSGNWVLSYSGSTTSVPASGAGHTATFSVGEVGPASGVVAGAPSTVVGNTSYSFTVTVPGSYSGPAQATAFLKWGDGAQSDPQGKINLDGSCKPSHVAAAPSAHDGKCVNHDPVAPTITIPSDAGVTYKVDGVTKTGTVTVSAGSHNVVASSSTYTLSGQTSWSFDLSAAPVDCNDVVTPVAATVTQSICVTGSTAPSAPTLALASTTGVTYTATPSSPYSAGQSVTVTATTNSGYEFKAPAPAGWTFVNATHETFNVVFDAAPDCKAAVSPVAPTVTQSKCVASGSPSDPTLVPATTTGISYSVNPAAPYAAGESVIVTATTGSDYKFVPPAGGGWTYVDSSHETYQVVFDTAPTCVSPENPAVTQSVCPAAGTTPTAPAVVYAPTSGITYSVSPSAPFAGGQTVTVTATASAGHEFFTNAPNGWIYVNPMHETFKLTFDASPKCAQPAAPMFTEDTCVNYAPVGASYTIPTATGVDYLVSGVVKPAGTYPAIDGSSVTVTAEAQTGYTLTGTISWTHEFSNQPKCTTDVAATPPTFTDDVCQDYAPQQATYTIPSTTGVDYLVEGVKTAAGTYDATDGSTLHVTAQPRTGYTLTGTTSWNHTFAATPTCKTEVAPTPPSFTDDVCEDYAPQQATYTIPATTGVDYYVEAVLTAAGTYSATDGSTVHVTAQPQPGFILTGTTSWYHTFSPTPTCKTEVMPAPPTFNDDVCVDYSPSGASYTIPGTTGVDYFVDGVETAAGTYDATDGSTVTVTAQPQPGYTLDGTTTWTHAYPATPKCTTDATPADPTFVDAVCSGSATLTTPSYTVPAVVGTQYLVDGIVTAAGDYVATPGTTITVTVQPLPGYTLTDSPTWTHTYPVAAPEGCVDSVIAAAASFTDPVCSASGTVVDGSYTVPQSAGVVYTVQGATVAAGTYPADPGTTITIVAGAEGGHALSGVTQWTHTFTAPNACLATGPRTTPPPANAPVAATTPPTTAYTGVPVGEVLLTGLALILLGVACYVGAATRRRGEQGT